MSNYVLVRGGSDRNGEDWSKIKGLLEACRHKVFCPSLSAAEHSSLTNHVLESEKCLYVHTMPNRA